jgi:regulator of sigma E protease
VNGHAVSSWSDIQQVLVEAAGQGQGELGITLTVQLNLAGEPTEQVELNVSAEGREKLAGLSWMEPGDVFFAMLQTPVKAANPWEATQLGFAKTNQFMMQAYLMLVRLIQGSVPPEAVSGPVGILDAGTRFTKEGWSYLLFFLGLLSVNLAVINFLPIPIADGGQAVFLLIEKIKGSPVSAGIQQAAMWVGLALIGFVFLFVTYHDVARKIQELTQ